MKILLDECIPRKLKNALPDHECQTVPEAAWLARRMDFCFRSPRGASFDLFVTKDKGLQYQQNLAGRSIAILIVRARIESP